MIRKRILAIFILVALALAHNGAACAQTSSGQTSPGQNWPTAKPITVVVPFPPGTGLDLLARSVANKVSLALDQTLVIENRSGANGTIGSNAVARAAPDGYTILAATAGPLGTAVHLMKNIPFDPLKDFTPIVAGVEPVTCLAVSTSLPVNSVQELIDYAKVRPGELSFGSTGVGSVFHLMGEFFNETAGVKINHVPYRGVAPAMQDVVGGHIAMTFISVSNALGPMHSGQIKVLAVLEPTRFAGLPDVPSMSEIVPAFRKPSSWFGFLGPAGLPTSIVTRLNSEIVKALNAPEAKPILEENGLTVIGGSPDQFAALMRDTIDRFGVIIKRAGIPPE